MSQETVGKPWWQGRKKREGCQDCEHFRACSQGYHSECPRHEWESMMAAKERAGNLDGYFAAQDARRAPFNTPMTPERAAEVEREREEKRAVYARDGNLDAFYGKKSP